MAEVCDGGGDDGLVEEGLVAGVGDEEGGVEEFAGETGEAAAGAEDEFGGGLGEQIAGGAGGAQGVFDHGEEGEPVEAGVEVTGRDDSHGEGLVLLGLEAAVEGGLADEPEGEEGPLMRRYWG